jgi:Tol biopolymer transport system component
MIGVGGGGGEEKEEIKPARLRQIEQVSWLPDGESLVASATDGGKFYHLWKIFYPDGDVQRITNGLNTYGKISVSADGKKILASQTAESSNIFVASQDNLNQQKQITFGNTNNVGQSALDWVNENRLVYIAYSEENPLANLWTVNTTDNSRQSLTANTDFHSDSPTVSADGKFVYFMTNQSSLFNVCRIDADNGGNLTQITDGKDGFRMFPQISSDNKFLYYIFRNRQGAAIKRLDLAKNKEEILLEKGVANPIAGLSLSLNGSRLVFMNWTNKVGEEDDKTNFQFGVASTENPADIRFFDVKLLNLAMKMTADGKAFDYVSWSEGKTMILRQNIEGGEPQEIFSLPKGRIFNFAWSKSGSQLAISYGQQNKDAVLLTNFE